MAGSALTATLALGGMCLLMWYLARLAKRRMGIGAGTISASGLRVVGKRALDQKSALYVVEIAGGRHILVGSSIDGSVSKVDDITADEFAAMSTDSARASRPALRVAGSGDGDAGDDGDDDASPVAATPQFATVGESFTHLLGKARRSRSGRQERPASGE